jgi:hypothetical protein
MMLLLFDDLGEDLNRFASNAFCGQLRMKNYQEASSVQWADQIA